MTTRAAGMPRSQRGHADHQHQHQPPSAREAHALMLDLAGAAAAATLMLVLTCWALSLGGAFQPGHVETHPAATAVSAATAAAARH